MKNRSLTWREEVEEQKQVKQRGYGKVLHEKIRRIDKGMEKDKV